jgi:phosphoesterase RecJ-like protein
VNKNDSTILDPEVPSGFIDFLNEHDTFILATHTEPDGDCIASSLALGSYLQRVLGKRVHHLNVGPFERKEIIRYQKYFEPRVDRTVITGADRPAAIILDCTGPDRIGEAADDVAGLPTGVVDHHASGEPFGDARFVVTTAAASCYLIQLVLEALSADTGIGINGEEAYLLFFGIATDTGFFRHIENDSAGLLAAVARLTALGVSPKQIHAHMFGGKTLASRKLLGALLERARPIGDGSAILTYETREDTEQFGRISRDSDPLYQLILSIDGVRAAALIREENDSSCTGSLRSTDSLDVSRVAQIFGGGGHKRAAGFSTGTPLKEMLEQVETEMIAAMREDQANS